MNRSSKLASILISALFVIPFVIFSLFWLTPWVSVPLILACIYIVSKFVIEVPREIIFNKRDVITLILIALFLLAFQYQAGYTGAFPQHADFTARNAIYGSLCSYSWPAYSEDGYALVSYFSAWLPSALLSKLIGYEWRNHIQIIVNSSYLFAAYILICYHCKKISFLPLVSLFTILAIPYVFGSGFDRFFGSSWVQEYHYMFAGRNGASSFYSHCTAAVNSGPIIAFGTALALLNYKRIAMYLFIGALCVHYSPLVAVGLFPIIVYQVFKGRGLKSAVLELLSSPLSYVSIAILAVTAVFITQASTGESSFYWGLDYINKDVHGLFFLMLAVNVIFTLLLFFWVGKKKPIFWISMIGFYSLPFIGYGVNYNEILFKSSLPFLIVLATLYPSIWNKNAKIIPKILATFCILCFLNDQRRDLKSNFYNYYNPSNIKDPYNSDYYSEEARTERNKSSTGFKAFGGVKDELPSPKIPYILRRKQ